MNLFSALILFVFIFTSGADNYQEYSTFVTGEDFESHFFSDEVEDQNYTAKVEELKKSNENLSSAKDETINSTKNPFPDEEIKRKEAEKLENVKKNDSINFDSELNFPKSSELLNLNTENDKSSENGFITQFSSDNQNVYENYEASFRNKEKDSSQPPMRREINAWRGEPSHSEKMPWSMEAFYPRYGSTNAQKDYYDDSSYAVDPTDRENNTTPGATPGVLKDYLSRDDQSYYEKNYYYNYYSPAPNHKYNPGKQSEVKEAKTEEFKITSKKKSLRKNACKQYLQFLKYAFEKLDENPEYDDESNEDYNEEWNVRRGMKNSKVFAVHLLGPTLYVDNSGKVFQINAKESGLQSSDSIKYNSETLPSYPKKLNYKKTNFLRNKEAPSIPKTSELPFRRNEFNVQSPTLPPKVSTASPKTEKMLTPSTTKRYDQPKTTTETPWLVFSLKTNLTSSNVTKEKKLNPDIQHRSSYGTRIEEEWRQRVGDDMFETTVRTRTEHTMFDEYDYGDAKSARPSFNTYPPKWFPSEEYYRRLAETLKRKENDSITNAISSETNAAVGPSLYFLGPVTTTQPTTFPPMMNRSHLQELTESPVQPTNRSNEDCNDKMLPCPDTVNVTYPLNGYCNRYVSCESGRAIRKMCPEGLHFNIITKSCDLPHNSFCTYTCPAPNGRYGIPGDCNGYFVCKNFVPEYRMCPPKMHWDINKSSCTFAELSSCPMKCSKVNEVKHYEGDCKAYIVCLNGIPFYHKCPPSTEFDRNSQTCIPKQQSKCEDDPKLLTKTSNPNHLCRNVEVKLGTKVWCNYFFPEESYDYRKQE